MKAQELAINKHVGKKVREARKRKGLSQTELGDTLGVTFQQIQKYENGGNRISAARLLQVSEVVEKPIHWFYEGLVPDPDGAELREQTKAKIDRASMDKVEAVNTLLSA